MKERPPITISEDEFKILLELRMCADPWPLTPEQLVTFDQLLSREAKARNFSDWVFAYHKLCWE